MSMFYFLSHARYDSEATYFDEGVRTAKKKQLEDKLLQVYFSVLYYESYS